MVFYCIEEFKDAFQDLLRKKSYSNLEADFIDGFLTKNIEELRSGSMLNKYLEKPYIKKRINGSGGYRVYYLLIIKESNVYLGYIHPKTGSLGSSNMEKKAIGKFYTKLVDAIQNDSCYKITYVNKKVQFNKTSSTVKAANGK